MTLGRSAMRYGFVPHGNRMRLANAMAKMGKRTVVWLDCLEWNPGDKVVTLAIDTQ